MRIKSSPWAHAIFLLSAGLLGLTSMMSHSGYNADANAIKPHLYEISKDGKSAYLFGTIEYGVLLSDIPESVREKIMQSQVLFTEFPVRGNLQAEIAVKFSKQNKQILSMDHQGAKMAHSDLNVWSPQSIEPMTIDLERVTVDRAKLYLSGVKAEESTSSDQAQLWFDKIQNQASIAGFAIVIDYSALYGESGLLHLLESHGYQVRRVLTQQGVEHLAGTVSFSWGPEQIL